MLSFVVQNFSSNTPIFFKTKKYNFFITFLKIPYLYKTLIYNLSYTNYVNYSYMLKPKSFFMILISHKKLLNIFLKFLNLDFGLYTNIFSKSLIFYNISKSLTLLDYKNKLKSDTLQGFIPQMYAGLPYLKPCAVLHFSVAKKAFKTIIIFIFYLISISYISRQNDFCFNYNFILTPHAWYTYPLYNTFYFKIYHY